MLHCQHCSVGSDCIDFLSKLTLDSKDDPDLELFQMYICMRISRFESLLLYPAIVMTLRKKWHNETAATYQFTGMLLPNL